MSGVALSADGARMVTVDLETARIRDTAGQILHTIPACSDDFVALSADDKHVLGGFFLGPMGIWDAANGQHVQTFVGHTARITSMVLSPDGRRLWSSSEDGTLRLWDVASGKTLCTYMSLNGGDDWLAVTPDGRFDGSEEGMRLLAWQETVAGRYVDDEATRTRLRRPGLAAMLVGGNRPEGLLGGE